MNCADALRELVQAAVRFEFKAAHHQRIESERVALREAITRAQLLLSVSEPPSPRESRVNAPRLPLTPSLKALTGGKSKRAKKQKPSRKPS